MVIAIDGRASTTSVGATIALDALVAIPPAGWLVVEVTADANRSLEVPTPLLTYPGAELRLYLDHDRPTFGVFRPVAADLPPATAAIARQPLVSISPVTRIDIVTRIAEVIGPPLVVERGGQPTTIPGAAISALRPHAGKRPGWELRDVIGLATPAVPTRVRIIGATTVEIDTPTLQDPSRVLLLKRNQRGLYVFRMWVGDAKHPTAEVRDVTRLVVEGG